jgi:hypothetical protein
VIKFYPLSLFQSGIFTAIDIAQSARANNKFVCKGPAYAIFEDKQAKNS